MFENYLFNPRKLFFCSQILFITQLWYLRIGIPLYAFSKIFLNPTYLTQMVLAEVSPALIVNLFGERHELPASSLDDAMEMLNHMSVEHAVEFGIEQIFSLSELPQSNIASIKNAKFYYSPTREDLFYTDKINTFELSKELLEDYQSIVGPVLHLTSRKRNDNQDLYVK